MFYCHGDDDGVSCYERAQWAHVATTSIIPWLPEIPIPKEKP